MATNGGPVQCAGGSLGQHRHICAFFNNVDEQHRVLRVYWPISAFPSLMKTMPQDFVSPPWLSKGNAGMRVGQDTEPTEREESWCPHQQVRVAGRNHLRALQKPLASRIFSSNGLIDICRSNASSGRPRMR